MGRSDFLNSLPKKNHNSVQKNPNPPTALRSPSDPKDAAMDGNTHIAAAEPKYIPDVVTDVAIALSFGGIV